MSYPEDMQQEDQANYEDAVRDALASEAPTQEEIERERLNWWPPARE